MKPVRIIIFAKAPVAGFAKTRLIPALGAEGAAALARRMLQTALSSAINAGASAVELCVTPDIETASWKSIDLPPGIDITHQGNGDLGARMARPAQSAIERGEAVLLIGTDCAEMSPTLLGAAAARLQSLDSCIHPAADGGYLVLGLTQFSPRLFDEIAWSTHSVAAVTIERIHSLGWSLHIGDLLHDIDTPDDLRFVV
jgi:rSAM/selenodomain-associated transferase 1